MQQPTRQDSAGQPVATMSPNLLSGLLRAADQLGVPSEQWLSGLKLTRAEAMDPTLRVPDHAIATVIERALPRLPPSIGLDLGERQNIGNFGLVGLAMTTAATFGEAIDIGLRFTPVVGSLMRFVESATEPGTVALAGQMIEPNDTIHRFVCEEFFSSCLSLARSLAGPDLWPLRVEFSYSAPEYIERYREVFRCPIAFGQPQDRMVFDLRWMGLPLSTHNPSAAQQVLTLLRSQMPTRSVPGEVAAAVERLLRAQLPQDPKLAGIAAQLHVSERTLRRQLTGEGTSFHEIHDRVRIDQAYALLRDRHVSIASVGAAIGYKDPREFRRAFKRLTGSTPRAVRERLLEGKGE